MQKKDKPVKNEFRLQRLLKHHERTLSTKSYSVQRFDILIVTVSGAGLYVVFEILKYLKTNTIEWDTIWLKIAGLSFTASVILNFVSQWSCFNATKNEERWVNREIQKESGAKVDESETKKLDKRVRSFNKLTSILNICSGILLFIGIGILAIFNFTF